MKHHAHSHRPRQTPRIRTDDEIRDQLERIERRRERLAAGPHEVVVQIPWGKRTTAGQQQGAPLKPGIGYVRKSVTESADRIRREREDAMAALSQAVRAFDITEKSVR